jgi:phosphatidylinositol phospholipase C, delta
MRYPAKQHINCRTVYLENVKEIRLGSSAHSEIRAILPDTDISKFEDRWLTIIYTLEDSYKTLNVIAPTAELLSKWFDTLIQVRQLRVDFMGGILHSGSSIGNELWERHHFAGADVSKDDLLSYREVKALCWRLNFGGTEAELQKRFMESAKDHLITSSLTHDEFRDFVKRLKERPDIAKAFETTRRGEDFNFAVFKNFMKTCQKVSFLFLCVPHLNNLHLLVPPIYGGTGVPI